MTERARYVVCSVNGGRPKILSGRGQNTGPLSLEAARSLRDFYKGTLKRADLRIYPIELGEPLDE